MMKAYFQRALTVLLALLLALPLGEFSSLAGAAAPADTAAIKQRVSDLGLGADVKLLLSSERRLRGTIQAIEEDSLIVLPEHGLSPRRLLYGEIRSIQLAKLSYVASGQPDPVEVRRLVRALGQRKLVGVSLTSGQKLKGRIQEIGEDDFSVSADGQRARVTIPYDEVRQLKGKWSEGDRAALVGALVGAALVILLVPMYLGHD